MQNNHKNCSLKGSPTKRSSVRTNVFGFTLVELIVVITILVILGTIAFLNLGGFQSNARDSVRIENMSNLKKGLDIHHIRSGYYPLPEESISLMASGTLIGYQGFAKEQIGSIAKLSPGGTIDPLDPSINTTYSTNADATKMQAMVYLENGDSVRASLTPVLSPSFGTLNPSLLMTPSPISIAWREVEDEVHASSTSDYSLRFPSTLGDTLGILLDNGTGSTKNRPVQELASVSFTGVDVVNTQTGYTAVFTSKNTITGTGIELIGLKASYTQKNDPMIYDPSLVGYWDMETIVGSGLLADLSGNGNNGAGSGGITIGGMIGKVGKSTNFYGTNKYFVLPDSSSLELRSGASIAMWTKQLGLLDSSTHRPLCGKSEEILLGVSYGQSRVTVYSQTNPGIGYFQALGGTILTSDNWYYIVGTFDGKNIRIYENGVLKYTTPGWNTNIADVVTSPFIGGPPGSGLANGLIDEVRIYNRALSDSEIKALYTATK